MKGLAPLFLGIFGTFVFSWVGLTVIPNWQVGHLNPQSDEEGTDTYPQPQSGMVERGARVYAANGCIYCHSQQVRADYAANDIERKWGDRRSAPRDYIFDRPVFLEKMRMGQSRTANKLASTNWISSGTRWIAVGVSGFSCAKSASGSASEGASRITFSFSNRKCESGRITKPSSNSALASADSGCATDVFRRLAACASLFASQYQRRFEHAFVSFPL
ncbi:MAG: hypothetical protein DME91_04705 [Verrucomicrobia bacterium]|nr:MAG: hypothetical protein DME91_04705 [Verrucomicrobiota bacterium]